MGRFGVSLDDAANLAKYVTDTPELAMEGMYTHFSAADDDDMLYHVEHQVQNLDSVVESTRAQGIKVPMVHCANSAATMRGTQFHRDMVRVGISLYVWLCNLARHSPALTYSVVQVRPATRHWRCCSARGLPPSAVMAHPSRASEASAQGAQRGVWQHIHGRARRELCSGAYWIW